MNISIVTSILGLQPIIDGIIGIINKVVPDVNLRDKLAYEIQVYQVTSDFQNAMKQIEVNIEEAKSENLFVAGWRPFIGWVCGFAFAYHVILIPLIQFTFNIFGVETHLPRFNQELLSGVLYGMLGLGGFRTAEKIHETYEVEKTKRQVISSDPLASHADTTNTTYNEAATGKDDVRGAKNKGPAKGLDKTFQGK